MRRRCVEESLARFCSLVESGWMRLFLLRASLQKQKRLATRVGGWRIITRENAAEMRAIEGCRGNGSNCASERENARSLQKCALERSRFLAVGWLGSGQKESGGTRRIVRAPTDVLRSISEGRRQRERTEGTRGGAIRRLCVVYFTDDDYNHQKKKTKGKGMGKGI